MMEMHQIGGTRLAERLRTIDLAKEIAHRSETPMTQLFYFLADSGYGNAELYELAKQAEKGSK